MFKEKSQLFSDFEGEDKKKKFSLKFLFYVIFSIKTYIKSKFEMVRTKSVSFIVELSYIYYLYIYNFLVHFFMYKT